MAIHNTEIAKIFNELADLLEIQNENPFRIRAYRKAALTIAGYPKNLADLLATGQDLTEIPGIGEGLALKIQTIVETGQLPALKEAEQHTPEILSQLMRIEGLGPKRVKLLFDKLHIKSISDLKKALKNGRVIELKGFGEKMAQKISASLEHVEEYQKRFQLAEITPIAQALVAYLKKTKGAKKIEIAGSYRRKKETVGDLDVLVACENTVSMMQRFLKYGEVGEIMSQGSTRAAVRLRSGIRVDLRVVPLVSYGAALFYFTGSKAHNIAIRSIAVKRKLKINEYGVFKGKKRIASLTETEVYKQVNLPYIEPELREDNEEIEAAKAGKLPRLITLNKIRGDLHAHTKTTDGQDSLEDMANAAADRGYEYIAITDHSKHLAMVHGLDEKALMRQIKAIDRLNENVKGIVILKSIEVDILEDGSLDLSNDVLKHLDLTVCSIHFKFNLSPKLQTERIIRAMDNPYFNILGHPTGRLINRREPYGVNLERIMQAAHDRGCFLELNAQPYRFDLKDSNCKLAKEMKVRVVISTDAHSVDQLGFMEFGVDQARRGWLEADDVLNTRGLKDLRKLLKRK